MATTAVQHDRLKELLQCPMCIDVFTDPRTLPCLHTFCFKCISNCCKGRKRRSKVACPQCRQKFTIPDSGMDGLKKNFFIGNLLSVNQANLDETKKVVAEFRTGKQEQDLRAAVRKVEENLSVLNSTKLTFFDQVKCVETDIRDKADQMIQLIKNDAKKLLSDLNRIRTVHEQEIERVSQEFTEAQLQLTKLADVCCELIRKGTDDDIFEQADSLCSRTQELIMMKKLEDVATNLSLTNVIFSPSGVTCDENKNILGQVESVAQLHPVAQKRTLEPQAGSSQHHSKRRVVGENTLSNGNPLLLGTLNEPSINRERNPCEVQGVTIVEKYLYAIYYDRNHVEVFDCDDHFIKVKDIAVEGMKDPNDMVGSNDAHKLFISDYLSGVIWRVDLKTHASDLFIELVDQFVRLSLVDNRLLVTTTYITMYDIHCGSLMKTIVLHDEEERDNITWRAVESNRDSFYVSFGNAVSEIDSEGRREIRVFNNEGQLDCEQFALDSVGRLLLLDNKNCQVILLGEDFKLERIIINKEHVDNEYISALFYEKNSNRLAVGLSNGQIKLFECEVN